MSRNDKSAALPPPTARTRAAIAACVVGTLLLTGADLASKQWALDNLSLERSGEPPPVCEADEHGYLTMQRLRGEAVVLSEGMLELRYAENCGAAFGLLRTSSLRHIVFGLAALGAIVALGWMFVTGRGGALFAWSVPFIVSGALGNLHDRVRYGYVVDFIRFWLRDGLFGNPDGVAGYMAAGWEWPTFNIADATITVGVVLLLIDGFVEGRREKRALAALEGGDGAKPEPAEASKDAASAEEESEREGEPA